MSEATNRREEARADRYGTFETAGDDLVVYDREEPTAWIQSSAAVDLGYRRVPGPTERLG
ncbi:MAG: hypothetical protein ABEJ40_08620 [Haloarculaceae archaeon]